MHKQVIADLNILVMARIERAWGDPKLSLEHVMFDRRFNVITLTDT